MASSLQDFYEIKPEDNVVKTETVTVKAVNGKDYDVEVKGLPYQQFARIKLQSTYSFESGTGMAQNTSQIEELTFCLKLCAAGIISPSLNDVKLRQIHNTHNSEDLVTKLFPATSIVTLGSKIGQLSMDSEDVVTDEDGNIVIDSGVDEKKLKEAKN